MCFFAENYEEDLEADVTDFREEDDYEAYEEEDTIDDDFWDDDDDDWLDSIIDWDDPCPRCGGSGTC